MLGRVLKLASDKAAAPGACDRKAAERPHTGLSVGASPTQRACVAGVAAPAIVSKHALVPVADLDIVRRGLALAGLEQPLQAHQEGRPLRAAVVHELHRLAPALVPEQHDRVAVLVLEVEADPRADPLGRPFDDLPEHELAGPG